MGMQPPMGMGMGMGMSAPPPPPSAMGTIAALKNALGVSSGAGGGSGGGSTHQQSGSGLSAPPVPLSVAQLKALEKQQKAAKEAELGKKPGKIMEAAGKRWRDATLDEWPENDHRIFVGDLGNEVTDDTLAKAFQKYSSFAKAKVVRDPRTKKTKGFGFVSFLDSADFAKALKEMQGKYIGNRPCKLSKSSWDERMANVKANKPKKQKTAH